jgi:PD-(D/E)XK nuclease superfamily
MLLSETPCASIFSARQSSTSLFIPMRCPATSRLYEQLSPGVTSFGLTSVPPSQAVVVLSNGEREISIFAQRRYVRSSTSKLHAIASAQIPDISIQLRRGSSVRLLLLDPKYKLLSETLESRLHEQSDSGLAQELEEVTEASGPRSAPRGLPKKIDIDKMHTYRDAIRGSDGASAVVAAYILYPGDTVRFPQENSLVGGLRSIPGEGTLEGELHALLNSLCADPVYGGLDGC